MYTNMIRGDCGIIYPGFGNSIEFFPIKRASQERNYILWFASRSSLVLIVFVVVCLAAFVSCYWEGEEAVVHTHGNRNAHTHLSAMRISIFLHVTGM